jgi:hypothetical protein
VRETVYIIADRHKVVKMTKSLVDPSRGQIICKIDVEIADTAFRQPTLERKVVINDWLDGFDLADAEFRGNFITEEEADTVRNTRLQKMKAMLEGHGYRVTRPEEEEEGSNGEEVI